MPQASVSPAAPTAQVAPPAAQGIIQLPRTRAEFDALVSTRHELRDQLRALEQRRGELLPQQMLARGEARDEMTARMRALDERSARLEQQILAADEAIAAAVASGVAMQAPVRGDAGTAVPPTGRTDLIGFERIMALNGIGFVLLGAAMWLMLRHRLRASPTPALADQSRRLEQLQQAVDTMAVEVERISEGQRFVTKLLNERLAPAVGAGDVQPVEARRPESIPARDPR